MSKTNRRNQHADRVVQNGTERVVCKGSAHLCLSRTPNITNVSRRNALFLEIIPRPLIVTHFVDNGNQTPNAKLLESCELDPEYQVFH